MSPTTCTGRTSNVGALARLRRSPLYERTAANGAVFGELLGWERPNWYAPDGVEREYVYAYGRQNWFEHAAAEHRAVREAVGRVRHLHLREVLGARPRRGAASLQRICAADIDVPTGRIVYTQWLNEFGGIEADVTVTRLGEREFLVLSGPGHRARDLAWIRRHIADDEFVTVTDVSGTMAMIAVMGPQSRELLQPLTDCDLSNEAFPFGTSREIDLGLGFVRATRITYVGELGWELLVPTTSPPTSTTRSSGAGRATPRGLPRTQLAAAGEGLPELGPRHLRRRLAAGGGAGFTIAWDKPGGFIGRQALRCSESPDRRDGSFSLPSKIRMHLPTTTSQSTETASSSGNCVPRPMATRSAAQSASATSPPRHPEPGRHGTPKANTRSK